VAGVHDVEVRRSCATVRSSSPTPRI
jgi:hypothetical protein